MKFSGYLMMAAFSVGVPSMSEACSPPGDHTFFFSASSSAPLPAHERVLGAFVDGLTGKDPRCIAIEIHGHVDEAEASVAAADLDRQRIAAVVRLLRERGLHSAVIEQAHGSSEPLVFNPPGSPEPQNRRVRVMWRYAPGVASRPDSKRLGMSGCRLVEVFLPEGISCGFSL
jgi:hypothetical protein